MVYYYFHMVEISRIIVRSIYCRYPLSYQISASIYPFFIYKMLTGVHFPFFGSSLTLNITLFACVIVCLFFLSLFLHVCPCICLSVCFLPVFLSAHVYVCLSLCMHVCLSVCLFYRQFSGLCLGLFVNTFF